MEKGELSNFSMIRETSNPFERPSVINLLACCSWGVVTKIIVSAYILFLTSLVILW